MIINSLCNGCFQPFQLLVEPNDVHLVKEIADEAGDTCPCPRLCGGRINLVGDPVIGAMAKDRRLKQPMSITGKQLYQAVNGMGLPDEVPKSGEVVNAILIANNVVKASWEEDPSGNIYLHELTLKNGMVVHLTSGARGAQVLKVTKGAENGG